MVVCFAVIVQFNSNLSAYSFYGENLLCVNVALAICWKRGNISKMILQPLNLK